MFGTLTIHLQIPGCSSLKEKRRRLVPLLHRLHREFNVSVAEMDLQDKWQESVIACGMVNSSHLQIQRSLQQIEGWMEHNWPDVQVLEEKIELV